MTRSYYSNTISDFLLEPNDEILGKLARHHSHNLEKMQNNAWIKQITILKDALGSINEGHIYFEFAIPRMGRRVDNILIIQDFIFVLEFKVGDTEYYTHCIEQVVDYSLDLHNFHEGSHREKLVPILIATKADNYPNTYVIEDNLFNPLKANVSNLAETIRSALLYSHSPCIDAIKWEQSVYKPTPTIIEAAQALYRNHSVKEISRNDAGAINLSITTSCINDIIEHSKHNHKKSICFLTGVPGAGKTLAGLNIANERMKSDNDEHAVFLSGNGPLVDVLREALARDQVLTATENGKKMSKANAKKKAEAFIQNIHHFRDDNYINKRAPIEKVVVFDEAQRAWAKDQVSSFMKRKKGVEDFDMSEPEFLIDVMNRHSDWCTIICLIGGGQEINTGEAGVSEWLNSLKENYSNWDVYYSDLILSDNNYLSNEELRNWLQYKALAKQQLHLGVSIRSFRSEKISELMQKILEGNATDAIQLLSRINNSFPIQLTRDLNIAKSWLQQKARGSERIGIVTSSGGKRLRSFGIDAKNVIEAPNWFLNNGDDVRSSNYLEDVATEFHIQGLEIDWVCLAWDINLYYLNNQWNYQNFSGTNWNKINSPQARSYLLNAYRVLLTRARQGLIIFVPEGDDNDWTRPKKLYDCTFEYLKSCGIATID